MNAKIVGSIVLVAIVVAACSSSSSSSGSSGTPAKCPAPSGCPTPDPATTDLMNPAVSFSKDVLPTFQASCALSLSCHQEKMGGPSQLYLGLPSSATADPAGIIAATVNVPAVELPSMMYVAPGDPENSFLMRKMDGELCDLPAACATTSIATGCGTVMPQGACALPAAKRDAVRRWIAQGALNN